MIHSVRCACICVYFVIYVYNVSDGKQEAATIEKEELKKALRFSEIYIAGEELGRGFLRVDPHARALMNFGAAVYYVVNTARAGGCGVFLNFSRLSINLHRL